MNAPPNREVAIFSAVLELDASQRAAYLDDACADDPALRAQPEALPRVHQEASGFLEAPAARIPGMPLKAELSGGIGLSATSVAEKPGDRIGRYKLLQQIGEGGFQD